MGTTRQKRITFDGLHRTHYICLFHGRTPIVNFRVCVLNGTTFDLGIRLAFVFCVRIDVAIELKMEL